MTNESWKDVHAALTSIAARRAETDHEEAAWLLRGLRERVHVHLGFGSYLEYLERTLGYTPRQGVERLRVAQALPDLPQVSAALRDGVLSWSAVREITRVATPATEGEWVEAARTRTAHQVEDLVSGLRPGALPTDAPDEDARRHVLRFEVAGETLALFRDARGALEAETGHSLSDDEVLMLLARRALGGPTEEGRASYQIAMTVCDTCSRGWQAGHGEQVAVGPEIVEMAECDAQHIGNTHVGTPARATQNVPMPVKRLVMRRDGGRCVVPGYRASRFLEVHHIRARHEGGDHDPDGLAVLCGAHHRATHVGRLAIEGRVSTGLVFQHADGTRYGGEVSPRAAEESVPRVPGAQDDGLRRRRGETGSRGRPYPRGPGPGGRNPTRARRPDRPGRRSPVRRLGSSRKFCESLDVGVRLRYQEPYSMLSRVHTPLSRRPETACFEPIGRLSFWAGVDSQPMNREESM